MSKLNISQIAKGLWTTAAKHTPEILTGIGVAGVITTVVIAVGATPKAVRIVERERLESGEQVSKKDVVRLTWKCYIPTLITGSLSIACLIGASAENVRRNAALAAAYSLSESALKGYREKVVETIGEKKEREIEDAIAKDKIEQDPIGNREVIMTQKGDTLCYDAVSGRYFKSDINQIKSAANVLSRRLLDERYLSLNEFYYEVGLDCIGIGDDLGWNVDDGLIDLRFSSQLAEDATPCLVIDYVLAPRYFYKR